MTGPTGFFVFCGLLFLEWLAIQYWPIRISDGRKGLIVALIIAGHVFFYAGVVLFFFLSQHMLGLVIMFGSHSYMAFIPRINTRWQRTDNGSIK